MFEVLRNLDNAELNHSGRRKALARKLVAKYYKDPHVSDDPNENLEEAILFLLTEISKAPANERSVKTLAVNEGLAGMCADDTFYQELNLRLFLSVDDDSLSNWPDLCYSIWLHRQNHIVRS